MIGRERLHRRAPALSHRRSGREALQTIAVKRAQAGKGIGLAVVRHAHMAHLWMHEAVHRPAVDDTAAPDARAYGHVDQWIDAPAGAPAELAERGTVDVGVDGGRDTKGALEH